MDVVHVRVAEVDRVVRRDTHFGFLSIVLGRKPLTRRNVVPATDSLGASAQLTHPIYNDRHCCPAVKVSCSNSSPSSGTVDLSRFRGVCNAMKENQS